LTLIEAISLVREDVPEVELAIVPWQEILPGTGQLPLVYSEVIQQLGLKAQVSFFGHISPHKLFKEVSVLVDPSFSVVSPSAILTAYLHS